MSGLWLTFWSHLIPNGGLPGELPRWRCVPDGEVSSPECRCLLSLSRQLDFSRIAVYSLELCFKADLWAIRVSKTLSAGLSRSVECQVTSMPSNHVYRWYLRSFWRRSECPKPCAGRDGGQRRRSFALHLAFPLKFWCWARLVHQDAWPHPVKMEDFQIAGKAKPLKKPKSGGKELDEDDVALQK